MINLLEDKKKKKTKPSTELSSVRNYLFVIIICIYFFPQSISAAYILRVLRYGLVLRNEKVGEKLNPRTVDDAHKNSEGSWGQSK